MFLIQERSLDSSKVAAYIQDPAGHLTAAKAKGTYGPGRPERESLYKSEKGSPS